MLRLAHKHALAFVTALAVLAAARPAAASSPMSFYSVPTRVELLPSDDAATRVVIHGAFFQLTSETTMTYTDPKCGVMYFECVAGQETMCRMQWKELRASIVASPSFCQGFGTLNVVSKATIRTEGSALGQPDAWDLGMGISSGVYVDNKCPPAGKLSCPLAGSDGGTVPPNDAEPA